MQAIEKINLPVENPEIILAQSKGDDELSIIMVGTPESALDIESMSRFKLSHPCAGSRFYEPKLGELNSLHHAIISARNLAGWTTFGFATEELSTKPFGRNSAFDIPEDKYGIWRVVKQMECYLSKQFAAYVQVNLNGQSPY